MKMILMISLLTFSFGASAQKVQDCDEAGMGIRTIELPVAKNSRAFANGKIQAYNLYHVEPACCSAGVAFVFDDVKSELGGEYKCVAITHLGGADVTRAKSSYDARKGLLLTIPRTTYTEDGTQKPTLPLKVRINLAEASVTLEK